MSIEVIVEKEFDGVFMSVQKYRIKKNESFTVISNPVIKSLRSNLEALGLYSYFLSLPQDWEFYKSEIRKTCKIGRDKLDNLLKELQNMNLVKITQTRNKHGLFSGIDIQILDGSNLMINNESRLTDNPLTDNPLTDNQELDNDIYKTYIDKEKNNTNISTSSDDDEVSSFKKFWNEYPKKVAKKNAAKAWKKIDKKLHNEIIENVKKRKLQEWSEKDKQYIPNAASWLNAERWNDEIIKKTNISQSLSNMNASRSRKSTVPFYKTEKSKKRLDMPGHVRDFLKNLN